MRQRDPRPLGDALPRVVAQLAPASALASVQMVWSEAVGGAIAAESEPVALRDGTLTVGCRSAVWANELTLLGPQLVERVNGLLQGSPVTALRCTARPPRRATGDGSW